MTLLDFTEADICEEQRLTGSDGRLLQRRVSSKGIFQSRKAMNRRRSASPFFKDKEDGSPQQRLMQECTEESTDLVKILNNQGLDEITEVGIQPPVVLDCSEGSSSCSSSEGACCGSPDCRCARVSPSLCRSEKCVSDEVVDFCCETTGGQYNFDFCEGTCELRFQDEDDPETRKGISKAVVVSVGVVLGVVAVVAAIILAFRNYRNTQRRLMMSEDASRAASQSNASRSIPVRQSSEKSVDTSIAESSVAESSDGWVSSEISRSSEKWAEAAAAESSATPKMPRIFGARRRDSSDNV